tara:strand:+ start:161 stop:319 length:159 start_codon:yes stop_codon:yes gene_type:complete
MALCGAPRGASQRAAQTPAVYAVPVDQPLAGLGQPFAPVLVFASLVVRSGSA